MHLRLNELTKVEHSQLADYVHQKFQFVSCLFIYTQHTY